MPDSYLIREFSPEAKEHPADKCAGYFYNKQIEDIAHFILLLEEKYMNCRKQYI